ncbi:hypothetical protein PACTADRAFT_40611 [Pachysolen tannophilus NRRL Y-2460]|uniref:Ubiquitin thioesterase OTU n=1 Tax=Pachysolen tannophilus NRRL Y-2460 TaxID=669874 RepID=A0A1E4TXL5_PACTA|nr:hypothetical protein PACTADRAFT_40611 [Pachysolen tannophilus NRRL Y-2460]
MRLKVRFKDGTSTVISVDDNCTLDQLIIDINGITQVQDKEIIIKFGFPPRQITIVGNEQAGLKDLGIRSGETLIIDYSSAMTAVETEIGTVASRTVGIDESVEPIIVNPSEIPFITLSEGYLLVRKIAEDNSCLFNSISYSCYGPSSIEQDDTQLQLRQIVSSAILSNKDNLYDESILGKSILDYSQWILDSKHWGGAIELGILAEYLNVEILTIDIESKAILKFNETASNFIIICYSGIHYDSICIYLDNTDNEVRVFDKQHQLSLQVLKNLDHLVQVLNNRGYYTNTNKFKLYCKDCKSVLVGERNATKHASETGHIDFEEFKS